MLGVLFTLPDASSTYAAIGAYSSPLFSEFLPLIYLIAGVGIPVLLIALLVRLFMHH